MSTPSKHVEIVHRPSGECIAEGPVGWWLTPFEGNWYISRRHLCTDRFRWSGVPGLCVYKFVYVWLHFRPVGGPRSEFIAWRYVIPNPLFPFIWFRVAVPGSHPDLEVRVSTGGEPPPLLGPKVMASPAPVQADDA